MLRTAAKATNAALRFGAAGSATSLRAFATKKPDVLPPLKVAVTGAAGQIGYALVMRIARYVTDYLIQFDMREQSFQMLQCQILSRAPAQSFSHYFRSSAYNWKDFFDSLISNQCVNSLYA